MRRAAPRRSGRTRPLESTGNNGFDVVRAYVRGKWETTQYLLDKAGKNSLVLFRGLNAEYAKAEGTAGTAQKTDVKGFTRLGDISLKRNGAASTSSDARVANDWDGHERVVLRIEVPRTAVIAVPAYGQNVYHEHETVVAGTAWKGWDVWAGKAPLPEAVPIESMSEHVAEAQHAHH